MPTTAHPAAPNHPPEEVLLGFARALRAAGVGVTADRERAYLTAAHAVGLEDQLGVYVAGRATMCSTPQDLARYDRVYAAWFGGRAGGTTRATRPPSPVLQAPLDDPGRGPAAERPDDDVVHAAASAVEVLRNRDIAELTTSERQRLARLFNALHPVAPVRRALRHRGAPHGRVDARTMLRDQLRLLGEPGPVRHRRRRERARRVVLLVDVSGSMSAYADALLRLAHRYAMTCERVEVFALGTRLTHLTRALRQPDVERALVAAGQVVPDWSGGTRLGQGLAVFLDRWGRRGMARGSVVVVFSDGWERDAPEALGEQMRRLAALAHRVVWVNPHRGKTGYEPVQQGMAAALPYVDDFVAGHSMATFERLTEVVGDA